MYEGPAHLVALDARGNILALSKKFNPREDTPGGISLDIEKDGVATRLILKGKGWTYDYSHSITHPHWWYLRIHPNDTLVVNGVKFDVGTN